MGDHLEIFADPLCEVVQAGVGEFRHHAASHPPSTTSVVPVVKAAPSLARYRAASAISDGLPKRSNACRRREASRTFPGSAWRAKLLASKGVSMAPGAMALTRMRSGAKSSAIVRVRLRIAPLAAI